MRPEPGRRPRILKALSALALAATAGAPSWAAVPVDLSGFRPERGVRVGHEGERVTVEWPAAEGETGRLVLDLRAGAPLVASLGVAGPADAKPPAPVLTGVDPVFVLTVGSRRNPPGRPPGMSVFNVFFDSPAEREFQHHRAALAPRRVAATGRAGRATVRIEGLSAGPFLGALEITVYAGAGLVHVEAVVRTEEADRALLYDAGLVAAAEPSG